MCYSMPVHDAGGKRLIEVPICVDNLDIEFHNLCYYPSGKKGESLCVPRAVYQECCCDRTYLRNGFAWICTCIIYF
jgi:hypothetical protein